MTFPFDAIAPEWRCPVFRPLFGLTLAWLVLLWWQGRALKVPSAPGGIVSLQLAGSGQRARAIVDGWREAGRLGAARVNLRLDWVFLWLYPVA